ncbi:hypothetical protein MARPO_0036s0152 [Marchantia polymorpha]|uniref:Uncharacterized protein n=1 Tax=Marchantia polymorpha TaxID=3197 RepID=A0A2R6X500_MARPO|nr:hypothetical protein MARPO_0036s0152 [Marchantia polymorpha]|eukprot:PTQ41182.1 hypothetical protein MARPO_0036s0152 [Marchantia polymorpha]
MSGDPGQATSGDSVGLGWSASGAFGSAAYASGRPRLRRRNHVVDKVVRHSLDLERLQTGPARCAGGRSHCKSRVSSRVRSKYPAPLPWGLPFALARSRGYIYQRRQVHRLRRGTTIGRGDLGLASLEFGFRK